MVILLGGTLRFLFLDRPAIWGDEAATFGRASSTFDELMRRLQAAGFSPTHYQLLWLIGQHTLLTPFIMRLVPAICGTLMIPAMYWLASQLIGHRAALLTALLVATNAFLLNYSRDAKMYSPFWFFAVLNGAALIWWLRVRTPLSWMLWVASGTAMAGFDALGWIIVVIELLMVLTARRGNWLSLLRLLPLALAAGIDWCLTLGIIIFPMLVMGHALGGIWARVVLAIAVVGGLRLIWLLARFALTFRTHSAADAPSSNRIAAFLRWPTERMAARGLVARSVASFRWPPLVLFVLGLLIMLAGPVGYYFDFNRFLQKVDERGWHGTGIDWVEAYDAGRDGPSLVGFTASAFMTSWEWPREIDLPRIEPRTLRLLTAGTLGIAAVLALGLLPFPSRRRLIAAKGIGGFRSAFWLALWITLPPYAFYCVSLRDHAGPPDWLRAAAGILRDKTWMTLAIALALAWFWISATTWKIRLLRVLQACVIVGTPLLLMEGIFAVYPTIDAAMAAKSQGWQEHGSVWMPRYVAVVLPAVLVVVSALLYRIPTRPLRWACVLVVVLVNLSVYSARLFAGTEPPTTLMARDVVDTQAADAGDGRFRVYFDPEIPPFGAEPGSVGTRTSSMRYYITIFSPRNITPINDVIESQMRYRIYPAMNSWLSFPSFIINDVRRRAQLRTFVTWERLEPGQIDLTDKPLDALAPDWRLASESTFTVRDHWRWKDTCVLRRREYVRNP
jgi:hypothetical protein